MSFYTPLNNAQAEVIEKRSRFIGRVYKISSEDEAKDVILKVKKEHHDAKHVVYAYSLASGVTKYSDDGEPSGTAGAPILDILKTKEMYNCLITVTRYFGGILLGTGGLVRAYSEAAINALEKAGKEELFKAVEVKTSLDYADYSSVKKICDSFGAQAVSEDFLEKIEYTFLLKAEFYTKIEEKITEYSCGKIKLEKISEKMVNFSKK